MALKRIAVGVVALAALGGGTGYALAASAHPSSGATGLATSSSGAPGSSGSSSSAPSSGNSGKHGDHRGRGRAGLMRLRTLQHAEWVTQDPKTHKDVTHDAVVGTITAVSSSSITVRAADGYTLTLKLDGNTRIHVAGNKGGKGAVTDLKTGQKALAAGIKSGSTVTAGVVLTRA